MALQVPLLAGNETGSEIGMIVRTHARLVCCMMLCLRFVTAQNPVPAPEFRAETNVVQVPVSVTGKGGRNIQGLTARDFKLLDDGVQREITLDTFDTGVAPISLVVAIQSTGISTPALTKIRRIGGMIEPLVIGSKGAAAIVTFDEEVNWLQDFTADSATIQDAVKNVTPNSGMQARMLDAIVAAADHMRQRKGRKVLLLISESRDRGSKTSFQDAMEVVQRDGIEIFAAHYSAYSTAFASKPEDQPALHDAPAPRSDGPDGPPTTNILGIFTELARLGKINAVQMLTQATGGSDYPFVKERGLENSIEKLGAEIHSQYILSFPLPADGSGAGPGEAKLHRIEVSVPGHPEYRIRSRQGYSR
jgi:VWFA-related protein